MSALIAGAVAPVAAPAPAPEAVSTSPRNFFLGLHDLTGWTSGPGAQIGEATLTSPPLAVPMAWNEMVPAWNVMLPSDAILTVEVRALYPASATEPAHQTKYYAMGQWSGDPTKNPRQSTKNQGDADGDVDTDTLKLKRRGGQLQLRLTARTGNAALTSATELLKRVRFVGLSFLDSATQVTPQAPNRAAWGKTVEVPPRCQLDYSDIGGKVWCSPTSVSMMLAHWSNLTARPELTMTVPQVAGAVLDPNWPGTGNWSFNASFAGSFPGMRGYVARLDDLSEVESWIAAGIPVALSVDYGLLKGKPDKTGGHLVVCVGFTETGDAIIADPGQHTEPGQKYRVFPRANVVTGWGASSNTVYLIYLETMAPPANTAHHWDG